MNDLLETVGRDVRDVVIGLKTRSPSDPVEQLKQAIKACVNGTMTSSIIVLEAPMSCAPQVMQLCAELHTDLVQGDLYWAHTPDDADALMQRIGRSQAPYGVVITGANSLPGKLLRGILEPGFRHSSLTVLVSYAPIVDLLRHGIWPLPLLQEARIRTFTWPERISLPPPPPAQR